MLEFSAIAIRRFRVSTDAAVFKRGWRFSDLEVDVQALDLPRLTDPRPRAVARLVWEITRKRLMFPV